MKCTNVIGLFLGMTILSTAGCVNPGDVDESNIYRLQQAILSRAPQDRPREGLGLMRPTTPDVPNLKVEKDPKTNKRLIRMPLSEAIMRALANNTDIAVIAYDPQIAREQVVQAAAAFDYVMFGNFGYQKVDTARRYRTGLGQTKDRTLEVGVRQQTVTGATWQVSDTFTRSWDSATANSFGRWYEDDLNMQITQPLLRDAWPEVNLAALRVARLNHKASLSQFRAQVDNTVTQVITAYYQLIQTRRNVEIAKELLDKTKETLKKVKMRSDIDATKVNISQAEAAVKAREAIYVETRKTRQDTQDALVRLLSDQQINLLQDYEILPTTRLSDAPVQVDEMDQFHAALAHNPDLEQARLAIQQADINVTVAKNGTLPSLNVSLGADFNGGSRKNRGVVWDDFWSGHFISYSAQLTFEYPIGNRERLSLLAQARLERKQLVAQLQNAADQIAQAVRERIRQIRTQYEEYKVQTEALVATRNQLEALNDLENIRGQLTPEFLNLKLQAQADVANAESAQLQAIVQYNTAMLDLNRVTGTTLEMYQVKLALPVASRHAGEELLLPSSQTRPAEPQPATQPSDKPADKAKPKSSAKPSKATTAKSNRVPALPKLSRSF
jgi:outer membrane protein TolC